MGFNATESQRKVMEADGKNQIVSASAGSGKTTVMVELISDKVVKRELDLSKVLLVTFTTSATNDMKLKLSAKLQEIIKTNPASYLKKQYDLVSSCRISTIDKLCQDLVKKYFYVLDIAPNFNVLSTEDMLLYRNKAFEKAFKEHLDAGDMKIMDLSLMLLEKRSQETLQKLVYQFYDFLCVQANKEEYLLQLKDLAQLPLENNPIIIYMEKQFQEVCQATTKELKTLNCAGCELSDFVEDFIIKLQNFTSVFELQNEEVLKAPKTPKAKEYKPAHKSLVGIIKKYNNKIDEIKCSIVTFDKILLEKIFVETLNMLNTLVNFTQEFEKEYLKMKRENNSFEFNDIEHFALQILNIDEVRCAEILDIDRIFIDEYQDVNELQDAILGKLSKGDNLFMVGDMKQSIYGFRLCAPYIFIDKYYDYLDGKYGQSHKLNENFRSNPCILEFVNSVFNVAMTKESCGIDYKNDGSFIINKDSKNNEKLIPVNIRLIDNKKEKEEFAPTDIYSVATSTNQINLKSYEMEGEEILKIIKEALTSKIYDAKTNGLRSVSYNDIAILFRNRSPLYDFVGQRLIEIGIPTSMDYKFDIFESFIAKFINSALKLMLSVNDDISLVNVMKFAFNFDEDELLEIEMQNPEMEYFYQKVLAYDGRLLKKTNLVTKYFERCHDKVQFCSVVELIRDVEKYVNLKMIILSKENGGNWLATYERFVEYVGSLKYNNSLIEYLLYIDKLGESKKAVMSFGGGQSVVMTTIHSSKGLEYPIVILAECGSSFKDYSKSEPIIFHRNGIGTYYFDLENNLKLPSPTYNYFASLKYKDELSEELRLLYVALTRPKNILYVTASVNIEKLKEDMCIQSNSFIKYIIEGLNSIQLNAFITNGFYLDDKLYIKLAEPSFQLPDGYENNVLNKKLKDVMEKRLDFEYGYDSSNISYKTSVTELSSQNSPHTYSREIEKLLIDGDDFEMSDLGTLYHFVFEKIDVLNVENESQLEGKISQLNLTEQQKSHINTSLIFNLKKALSVFGDDLILQKEKRFLYKTAYNNLISNSNVKDKVLLQGVIDLIITDKNGNNYIVDYKLTNTNDEQIIINRYRKQLEIYCKSFESASKSCVAGVYIYLINQSKLIKLF